MTKMEECLAKVSQSIKDINETLSEFGFDHTHTIGHEAFSKQMVCMMNSIRQTIEWQYPQSVLSESTQDDPSLLAYSKNIYERGFRDGVGQAVLCLDEQYEESCGVRLCDINKLERVLDNFFDKETSNE